MGDADADPTRSFVTQSVPLQQAEEDAAATKIQSKFRGKQAQKHAAGRRGSPGERESSPEESDSRCDVLFQRLDLSGSGEISVSDWRKAVEAEPEIWLEVKSVAEWDKIWLQLNPNGSVDFAQFMTHVMQADEHEFQIKSVA